MINFACPNCQKPINVPEEYAGKKGRCKSCGTAVRVPTLHKESAESSKIKFHCPACNKKMAVPAEYAGKKGKCKGCGQSIRVPMPRTEPEKQPVAAPENNAGPDAMFNDNIFTKQLLDMESKPPAIDDELRLKPVEKQVDNSQFSEYPNQYGTLPQSDISQENISSKKPASTLMVVYSLIFISLGLIIWGGVGLIKSIPFFPSEPEVSQFAEDYIYLLIDGQAEEAAQLLTPELKDQVKNNEIDKIVKLIGQGELSGEPFGMLIHSEKLSEGKESLLSYTLFYDTKTYKSVDVYVSVFETEYDMWINGISTQDFSGNLTASIGLRSYKEFEEIAMASTFDDIGPGLGRNFLILICGIIVLGLINITSMWIVFEKAGEPGWAVIVPYYNMWVLAEVGDKPGWWGLAAALSGLIPYIGPVIGFVLSILIFIGVSRAFGRGILFGLGLCFLSIFFLPILAFSDNY
ncbi:MAG: DUF5684 domain-containing protein [Planctomycetota bacterium]